MRTFWIQTLGCKVNQYESEQIAALLRGRGLLPSVSLQQADLRIVHTCSVTIQAASKSRQTVRRTTRLPVLAAPKNNCTTESVPENTGPDAMVRQANATRVIVTGCWAGSDAVAAQRIPGVDAVLGHEHDLAGRLNQLLDQWSKPRNSLPVKQNTAPGTRSLPLLDQHQTGHQRAFLKVQDGCDAHCTYCIIPRLRPNLWSKPIEDAVAEANRLIQSGHAEIVLTGIFLGAYGQSTALRHRQANPHGPSLGQLVDALCTRVPGLRRLRLSSLEPGDLTPALVSVLKSHAQVVPHFHLPLQSGSDTLLRRMNRQYRRDDFLRMLERVECAVDRPAITTDIIAGFPGETDAEFDRTLEIVDRARFIHIHAFGFSPRPGTAAARWEADFVPGTIVNQRIDILKQRAAVHGLAFRRQFIGQSVELLVEQSPASEPLRHGRSERYFDVHFEDSLARTGDAIRVKIDRVTPGRTFGTKLNAAASL